MAVSFLRAAACTLACLWASGPGAEPPEVDAVSRDGDSSRVGTWTVVLVAPEGSTLSAAVGAQMVDLPVGFVVESRPMSEAGFPAQRQAVSAIVDAHDADLVVWFELDAEQQLYLYLFERGQRRTLVRELESAGQSEAGRAASAAVIVRGVVEALVGGGHLGVEGFASVDTQTEGPEGPEPTAEAVPPTQSVDEPSPREEKPKERPLAVVGLGAAYGLEGFSRQRPVAHSIVVGPDLWVGSHVMMALRFRGTLPTVVSDQQVELRIVRYPLALSVRGVGHVGAVDIGGGIVGVVEIAERQARATGAGIAINPGRTRVGAALGPVAHVGWQVHRRVRLWLDLGADIHFSNVDFVLVGSQEPLLRPFAVRPRAQLGLTVALNPRKPRRGRVD